jgi:hypothetical protein
MRFLQPREGRHQPTGSIGNESAPALCRPSRGLTPHVGPAPTANAVGHSMPPATRANQGTGGDPRHVWFQPEAAFRHIYHWVGVL